MNRTAHLVALVLLGAAVCQSRPAAADADYPNRSIRARPKVRGASASRSSLRIALAATSPPL